jgi:hypothetical protein
MRAVTVPVVLPPPPFGVLSFPSELQNVSSRFSEVFGLFSFGDAFLLNTTYYVESTVQF